MNDHVIVISGSIASLRNSLYGMTPFQEAAWRQTFIRNFVVEKNATGKSSNILFFGARVCLKGFAILAGGPNYLRTCYRDIATMTTIGPHADAGLTEPRDNIIFSTRLRDKTHRSVALKAYLREVVEQLAENDPVTGKKVITVRSLL